MDDKDWKGDVNSIYKTLGASNHCEHDREVNDYYASDPKALELFLDAIKDSDIKLHKNIWECACGEGHLSKVLISKGYDVVSSDLINRNYGIWQVDFLKTTKKPFKVGDILTNPPYSYAEDFVYKAMELLNNGEYCVMFLKIQFLEGQSRYKLFQQYPPKYVYVHSTRQVCALNGEFIKDGKKQSSAVCYAWYVWQKGYAGDTIIKWIK